MVPILIAIIIIVLVLVTVFVIVPAVQKKQTAEDKALADAIAAQKKAERDALLAQQDAEAQRLKAEEIEKKRQQAIQDALAAKNALDAANAAYNDMIAQAAQRKAILQSMINEAEASVDGAKRLYDEALASTDEQAIAAALEAYNKAMNDAEALKAQADAIVDSLDNATETAATVVHNAEQDVSNTQQAEQDAAAILAEQLAAQQAAQKAADDLAAQKAEADLIAQQAAIEAARIKDLGENCTTNANCKSNYCKNGKCANKSNEYDACDSNNDCVSGLSCNNGKCWKIHAEGGSCNSGTDCSAGLICMNNVCAKPRNEYEACNSDNECAGTLTCKNNKCWQVHALGGSCANGSDCSTGLICYDNKCDLPHDEYGVCRDNSDCASGLLCKDNKCWKIHGEGGSCNNGTDCNSGLICYDNKCAPLRKEYESCGMNEDCASGTCKSNKCWMIHNEGGSCADNTDCSSGTFCYNQKCEKLRSTGQACNNDSECVSGNICVNKISVPTQSIPTANLRYLMKFKNKSTGKYLCLKPGTTTGLAYLSDGSGNECSWRTKIVDSKLQIIRNLNNNSIGTKLQSYIGYSADTWPADTKWNLLEEELIKNNYYSKDYAPGVQSNIDDVTGGCLTYENGLVKTGSPYCYNGLNKWSAEYVNELNCLSNAECPSGTCKDNICLNKLGEWCNQNEQCASGVCDSLTCINPIKIGDKIAITSVTSAGKRYLYECGPRILGSPYGTAWSVANAVFTPNYNGDGLHIWRIIGVSTANGTAPTTTTEVILQNTSSGRVLVYGGSSTGCNATYANSTDNTAFDVFTDPIHTSANQVWKFIEFTGTLKHGTVVALENRVKYNGTSPQYLRECSVDKTSCGGVITKWASTSNARPNVGGNAYFTLEKV